MKINWLRNLKIGSDKTDESTRTMAQTVKLLPGIYYRLEYEPEFRISHLSEQIFDLLGYQAKDLMNQNALSYHRIIYPEHEKTLAQKKTLCLQSREAKKLKYYLFTKSGYAKLVEDNFIGEYDNAGGLVAINGYLKELKKSSVKLQLHNQLEAYRAAIDVNIISSITDSNRKIIYVNDNFKKVCKYSDEEILGKTHDFLNAGHHPVSFFENLWQTISDGKMWQGEILTRAKDGSLNWAETVIIPTFDGSNQITSYLFLSVLTNERKYAEKQKEKYIGVLEKIAHIVAHDLRGPVCSILGLVNLYKNVDCGNVDVKQATAYLLYTADKLDQISRGLSDRIYAADVEMKKEFSSLQETLTADRATNSISGD